MTEYEKAEQDVAAAKVAERIAEWKAMEAKAAYYRYASEAMAASAEVMGSRIRRDNALASEFVEKANVALEAPAQPLDESGDQFLAHVEPLRVHDGPLIDAQTTDPVDPRVEGASDEPDALAEFMKLPGAVQWGWDSERPPYGSTSEVLLGSGNIRIGGPDIWDEEIGDDGLIRAYRILEAPAPEQPASVEIEPSPYAEAIEKGAITQDEADFLVSERERLAADEQAKFFGQGMMADADRHQSDQRGIVGVLTGMFKREREDA